LSPGLAGEELLGLGQGGSEGGDVLGVVAHADRPGDDLERAVTLLAVVVASACAQQLERLLDAVQDVAQLPVAGGVIGERIGAKA
jgi:hypothetical protein